MKAVVKVFIDDSDEASEEVEMPIPEPPAELAAPTEGWGRWRWVGSLPKTRIDLSENYCLAIYVVRVKSTQARKLGDTARRGSNRVPSEPPREEAEHKCEECGRVFDSAGALGGHRKAHGPTGRAARQRSRSARSESPGVQETGTKNRKSPPLSESATRAEKPERRKPGPPSKITGDMLERILKAADAGLSSRRIAEEEGISFPTVTKLVRAAGAKMASPRGGARKALTEAEIEEIARLKHDGYTTAAIVRETGRSKAEVNHVLKERAEALSEPDPEETPPTPPPERAVHVEARVSRVAETQPVEGATVDTVRRAIVFHLQGRAPIQIAAQLRIPPLTASEWVDRFYKRIDIPKPAAGPSEQANELWMTLGEVARTNLATRILQGN